MNKLAEQFAEDRELRNAARKNLMADIELLKKGWSDRGFVDRVIGRIGGGAQDVLERSGEPSEANRGVLGALIGAIVLWFASGAILEILDDGESADGESDDNTDLVQDSGLEEPEPTNSDSPDAGDSHE